MFTCIAIYILTPCTLLTWGFLLYVVDVLNFRLSSVVAISPYLKRFTRLLPSVFQGLSVRLLATGSYLLDSPCIARIHNENFNHSSLLQYIWMHNSYNRRQQMARDRLTQSSCEDSSFDIQMNVGFKTCLINSESPDWNEFNIRSAALIRVWNIWRFKKHQCFERMPLSGDRWWLL